MKRAACVLLVLLPAALCQPALGQAKNPPAQMKWQVFTPADKSFTVETPGQLNLELDPEDKSIEAYLDSRTQLEECGSESYIVMVVHLKPSDRGPEMFPYFLIGGSHHFPTSESRLKVDGLPARDYSYTDGFDSACKFRRGLIINAGDRVFLLIVGSNQLADLTSPSAGRFLKSFHVNRKKLRTKQTPGV